jgi:hypothetical protein
MLVPPPASLPASAPPLLLPPLLLVLPPLLLVDPLDDCAGSSLEHASKSAAHAHPTTTDLPIISDLPCSRRRVARRS